MGRASHANSHTTHFLNTRCKWPARVANYIEQGRPYIEKCLSASTVPDLKYSVQSICWLGWVGVRSARVQNFSAAKWESCGPRIRAWLVKHWPHIDVDVRCVYNSGYRIYIEEKLHVKEQSAKNSLDAEVALVFDKIGRMEAARLSCDKLHGRVLVARGSNHATVASLADGAKEVGARLIEHSVQHLPLACSGELRHIVKKKSPARLVFASAGRLGRATWKGDVELLASVGVVASMGHDGGGVHHKIANGGITKARRLGTALSGWWLLPGGTGTGTGVRVGNGQLVKLAKGSGPKKYCTLVGGDDRTLLHIVGVASRLDVGVACKLYDAGQAGDVSKLVVDGREVSPCSIYNFEKVGRVLQIDMRKCHEIVERVDAARQYVPTGRALAFTKRLG